MSMVTRIAAVCLVCACVLAVNQASSMAAGETNTPSANHVTVTPPIPNAKSPVETFRELLAMTSAQQHEFLAQRPVQNQNRLLAKIREYRQLTPNERELRLRETEMHYYLLPLMSPRSTNRAAQLAAIPEDTRGLIETRLAAWDQLQPAVQRELLENEATIRYFTEMAVSTPDRQQQAMENIPPSQRAALEAGISRWQAMPEKQRAEVFQRFEQFFELNRKEQENALNTLSEAERRNIEQTLRTFNALDAAQRAECVRSLRKYALLSPLQRTQFLQNAELWRAMRPDQRQAWRDLVARLSSLPPMPPGATAEPPAFPAAKQTLVTNRN